MHPIVDILRREESYHPANYLCKDSTYIIPDTYEYMTYWTEEFRRCIIGYWQNGRFMPPQLYFYINHYRILVSDNSHGKKSKVQTFSRPLLRDVEWVVFYNYYICRGFSGFREDDKYSCNRDLLNEDYMLHGTDINPDLYSSNGDLKKYIPAREYLYRNHEKEYMTPLYDNDSLNLCMMTSRGKGKSMICASLLAHEYVFNGAKTVEELNNPNTIHVIVAAQEMVNSEDTVSKFLQWFDDPPYSSELDGNYVQSPFKVNTFGSLKSGSNKMITQGMEHSYINSDGQQVTRVKGTKSTFSAKTIGKDAMGTAGKRTSLVLFEEIGKSTNLLEFHHSNKHTQYITYKFGTTLYIGTGGDIEKVQSSKKIFENPSEFDCLEFDDDWEGTDKKIGLFLPIYLGDFKYLDDRNLTDYEKGKRVELAKLETFQKRGDTQYSIDIERMNNPINPSDIFLNKKGNVFPPEISNHLKQILIDGRYKTGTKGWLERAGNKKGVEFVNDINNNLFHIDTFPISTEMKNNPSYLKGCVRIYEHPIEDSNTDLYRIGYDTVHYDKDEKMYNVDSLACMYVYKGRLKNSNGVSDTIVAEYIGRLPKVSDINEIAELLSKYYNNAKIMMETNIQANLAYFNVRKLTYLLAAHPLVLSDRKYNSSTVQQYGYIKNPKLAIDLEEWLKEWLTLERGLDEDGNMVYNYHTIYSTGLLQEIISYERGADNFDRLNAMFAIMVSYKAEDYERKVVDEKSIFIESMYKHLPNKYKKKLLC